MSRVLEFETGVGIGEAELQIFVPRRTGGEEFVCDYSLHAVGAPPRVQGIFGVDALQSLVLAIRLVVADSGRLLQRVGAIPGTRLDDELRVCGPGNGVEPEADVSPPPAAPR